MIVKLRALAVSPGLSLSESLKRWGHDVISSDTLSLLELYRNFQPEVVLIDLEWAEIDGVGLAAEIRAEPNGKMPLLIGLVTRCESGSSITAAPPEFDFGMKKPIEMHRLREYLGYYREAVERRRSPPL